MRIAFLAHWRGGERTGPFRKIRAQIGEWVAHGHEVGVFAATAAPAVGDWKTISASRHVIMSSQGMGKLTERGLLVDAVERWRPDIVYERHGLYYPAHRRLGRSIPIVSEVNGADNAEWRLKSRSKALYNQVTRGQGLGDCSGLVFVTHELQASQDFAHAVARVPTTVVANGIRIAEVPRAPLPPSDAAPRLLFVGHPHTPWHGVEDVISLARARPEWMIDIVGPRKNAFDRLPGNVTCFGELAAEELASRFAAADVGIGSLALYREGIQEACTLKVREYLAAGIPVVLGYDDTDFPSGAPFLLRVPNTAGGITRHLTELAAFIGRWKGSRVGLTEVAHLDVVEKEQQRLSFVGEVLARWQAQ